MNLLNVYSWLGSCHCSRIRVHYCRLWNTILLPGLCGTIAGGLSPSEILTLTCSNMKCSWIFWATLTVMHLISAPKRGREGQRDTDMCVKWEQEPLFWKRTTKTRMHSTFQHSKSVKLDSPWSKKKKQNPQKNNHSRAQMYNCFNKQVI